jgi:hypothetical protein
MQKDTDNINEMQSKTYEKEMWPQRVRLKNAIIS